MIAQRRKPKEAMKVPEDAAAQSLAPYDTAAELWPQLVLRAGLTGPRQDKSGPYDAGLIDALHEALFPGKQGEFDALIAASSISAEALLRAFFATFEPFAMMKEDILLMLADARARASGDSLQIRFNFSPGENPLDLLLEQFRLQMETIAQILTAAAPEIAYSDLWALAKAGFEDEPFGSMADPTRPSTILAWLANYNDGASFAPLTGGWETGDLATDTRIGRVVQLLNSLLAAFSRYGRTHTELREASQGEGREDRDASGFTIYELWIIESDYWPRAIGSWICQVHDVVAGGNQARLARVHDRVDEILPTFDDADMVRSLASILEDVLDLPVWKKRHEVYAIWIGAQIHRALRDDGWRFRFHLIDDRLEFAFRGVHLATMLRSDQEPELFWWTELRTLHDDLPNDHRKEGIQPDYRVLRSPLSAASREVLVVEAKQHLRSSNKEFREALEDYTHACPDAGVLLANHGPCSPRIMGKVAAAPRLRSAAYGEVHPGKPANIATFRQDICRVVDCALAGNITKAFEISCEVQLTWGAMPVDLDLHIFRSGGGHVCYNAPRLDDVELSTDVTSGFGPEIATLRGAADHHVVAVHHYSSDGDLSTSDASIEISWGRRGQRLSQRFAVPQGDGVWWHVAAIDLATGSITPLQLRRPDAPG
jgi:hypothetical protein